MKRIILLLFALVVSELKGQSLPVLKPGLGISNIYTKAEQLYWERAMDLYEKSNTGDQGSSSYESLPAKDKNAIDSLEMKYGPMTQGVGCSWYCGGGPYKETSSSSLEDKGLIKYGPGNLHDFNLLTAWVAGNKSNAIGSKINFHFKPEGPRVNEIIIYNGYIKNIELWKANSRVAKFKLLINGKPVAVLELEDVTNAQHFKIDPVRSADKTKDLIITLEILEVYKGSKYTDVAISEVNFDGLDVH